MIVALELVIASNYSIHLPNGEPTEGEKQVKQLYCRAILLHEQKGLVLVTLGHLPGNHVFGKTFGG